MIKAVREDKMYEDKIHEETGLTVRTNIYD